MCPVGPFYCESSKVNENYPRRVAGGGGGGGGKGREGSNIWDTVLKQGSKSTGIFLNRVS